MPLLIVFRIYLSKGYITTTDYASSVKKQAKGAGEVSIMAVIETKTLTTYYGKNRGIEGVNLCVEEGEIYGFVGPNGAGKSTLMRTLLNFIHPRSGEARILGRDTQRESKAIKEHLGYVPGEIKYYPQTRVIDLLRYGTSLKKAATIEQLDSLIRLLGIEGDKKFHQLSLGNKKKVALAQAFLGDPQLLILDEPTSGLDPLLQRIFTDLLMDFKSKGKSVFLSSHNLKEVAHLCDRASIIKDGRLIDTLDLKGMENAFGWIVTLKGEIPVDALAELAHEIYFSGKGGTSFLFKGSMDTLVRSLALFNLEDLRIKKEDIEDRFLRYYGGSHEDVQI